MIGDAIEHIISKGFLLNYTYTGNMHRFMISKPYDSEEECKTSFLFFDDALQAMNQGILTRHAEKYMKQVDECIAQRRLIEEALS